MKRTVKMLCFVLALLFATLCFTPAAEAAKSTSTSSPLPIIYIMGNNNATIYDKDGNKIWPLNKSIKKAISENQSAIVSAAVKSFTRNNWNILGDELYDTIAPLFKPLLLDENGNNQNGVTVQKWETPEKDKDGKYTLAQYHFRYDMRLDPLEVAPQLRKYINAVLEATGKSKVNLICRCMGASPMSAYLYKYKNDPKVASVIYYSSGAKGVLIEEAPFCGQITLDDETMSQYVTKTGEESLSSMFQSLTNIFGSSKITEEANEIMEKAMPVILPRLLRATYANFPSYWSLLDDEHYSIAKNYIYGGTSLKSKYAGLLQKTDFYHENVLNSLDDLLLYLKNVKGVNINVITKYNCDFDPIYDGHEADGDSWIETASQSFGATCAEYGKHLPLSYCDSLNELGLGNYISSDRKIDASTCLFPDSTWFIKNCTHTNWTSAVSPLVYAIFSKSTQVTVKTYSNFPQFMKLASGKLKNIYDYGSNRYPPVESASCSPASYVYNGNNKTPTIVVKSVNGEPLTKNVDYKVTYQEKRSSIGKHYAKVRFIGNYDGTEERTVYFNITPANISELKLNSYSTNTASISWTAAKGAKKYNIYSYNSSDKTWKKLASTTSTSYKVTNLTAGSNVKLAVKGVVTVSGEEFESPSYVNVTARLKPLAPTVKATAGKNQITLKWSKITGATSYQIFRANTKNGLYRRIATVTATKYVNKSLVSSRTFYYKIRAVKTYDKNNIYSSYSKVVSAKTK